MVVRELGAISQERKTHPEILGWDGFLVLVYSSMHSFIHLGVSDMGKQNTPKSKYDSCE